MTKNLYKLCQRRRKRRRTLILTIIAILIFTAAFLLTASAKTRYGASGDLTEPSVQVVQANTQLVAAAPAENEETEEAETENFYPEFTYSKDWDSDDAYLLAKIAMAEAEGESLQGKTLVILTVLNRVQSEDFPDTIREVIYQKNQFSPILDGRFDSVEPNAECWEAVRVVEEARYDYSGGALYFESCKSADSWHSRNLEFLYQCGNHKFYK